MHVSEHDFRHSLGCFATGVTIATTFDKQKPYGITINAFASLSLKPALILFNLEKEALHYPIFTKASHFTINILSESQQSISEAFASPSTVNWQNILHTEGKTHSPVISDCIACLECKKHSIQEGGDHSIIIGEVLHTQISPEKKPLVYFKGKYRKLGTTLERNN